MLVTVAGTHSLEEPPLTSHPGCWMFREGQLDGCRVQQRPPQARTGAHPPETLVQASPAPASPAEPGPLVQPWACSLRMWFTRQALLRPWTCFLLSVLSGRQFGVALLFTPPSFPSSCPSCFLLLTSRCSLLSVCLSPLTPQRFKSMLF